MMLLPNKTGSPQEFPVPAGFELKVAGIVEPGDLFWSQTHELWVPITPGHLYVGNYVRNLCRVLAREKSPDGRPTENALSS